MFVQTRQYYVYILTSYKRTVLYVGVTNNLEQRVIEHYLAGITPRVLQGNMTSSIFCTMNARHTLNAIAREKEIKSWSRKKKEALINAFNPHWKFLNFELLGEWPPTKAAHRRKE